MTETLDALTGNRILHILVMALSLAGTATGTHLVDETNYQEHEVKELAKGQRLQVDSDYKVVDCTIASREHPEEKIHYFSDAK
ncbi:hypothetical protein QTO01_13880 [Vibrio mytili]|uniref:hypothetical protein n=1 Tax=Vibrio mytili TaxID=50718 RepID=UPI002F3F60FD